MGGKFDQADLEGLASTQRHWWRTFDKRFMGALEILESFYVFNPLTASSTDLADFNYFNEVEVQKIASHFLPE